MLWNQDPPPNTLDVNTCGSHPFVMALAPEGAAWGYFLLSSNALEIVPTQHQLSWRAAVMFLLAGPTPAAVLQQLTRVAVPQ